MRSSVEQNKTSGHPRQANEPVEIEYIIVKKPVSRFRRVGCIIALVLWFSFLLLPLGLFILAVEGDITIARGDDIPEPSEHPRFQLKLIMEPDYRGISLVNTSLHRDGDQALCIQTNVRYVLWEGDGDPAVYCDCYVRARIDDDWTFVSTAVAACD